MQGQFSGHPGGKPPSKPGEAVGAPGEAKAIEQLRSGQQHERAGRAAEAEGCYRKVLSAYPSSLDALRLLGYLLLGQRRFEEALVLFGETARLRPDIPGPHDGLGQCCYAMRRYGDAVDAFSRAVGCDPANPELLNRLATALGRDGRLEGAVANYRRVLELSPGSAPVMLNLGKCLQDLDRVDDAMEMYRAAIEADPSALWHVSNRLTNRASGRFWLKVEDLRKALSGG